MSVVYSRMNFLPSRFFEKIKKIRLFLSDFFFP
nr:MAG TPA: hypothetical protein [Caudoviricetes sp.]